MGWLRKRRRPCEFPIILWDGVPEFCGTMTRNRVFKGKKTMAICKRHERAYR